MLADQIKRELNTEIIGKKIIYLDQVDSTNQYARQLIETDYSEGTVIIASEQTQGKGQQGRKWFSPKGQGIYLSFIIKPFKNINELSTLTLVLAAMVVDWIEKFAEIQAEIDPPNDIVIRGRKVCGILTERLNDQSGSPVIIIGIGINLNVSKTDFPEEITKTATSLSIESKEKYDYLAALRTLIQILDNGYKQYLS